MNWNNVKLCLLALLITMAGAEPVTSQEEQPNRKLTSARTTMRTFLEATHADDYSTARQCLDFSAVDEPLSDTQQQEYARNLKGVIDRMAWVDYALISDDAESSDSFRFPPDQQQQPIVISRGDDGAWRFSAETVARIPQLWAAYQDQPLMVAGTPWYRRSIPIIDNEYWRIAALFISLLVALIVGRIIKVILGGAAATLGKRGRQLTSVTVQSMSRAIPPVVWAIGLSLGLKFLVLNNTVRGIADTIVGILFAIAIAYMAHRLVDVVDSWLRSFSERTSSKMDDMLVPMIRASLRVTIVVLLLVQIATILSDKPVTSIIAGLSVGGLAVGLAAQETIKNFFGSIMIFSDRPFELGDRITVDGFDGAVEAVGFRSTRLRTLEGHVVTIPNGELANKSICNIAKRPSIRRIMGITVTYDTSPEMVQRAVEIVKEVLSDHEGMDPASPPRVFFNEFGDTALNIFAIYWYHPADWWAYCAFSERVNFEILNRFNAEGIEFAFPTQTLYLAGDPNRPLPALESR